MARVQEREDHGHLSVVWHEPARDTIESHERAALGNLLDDLGRRIVEATTVTDSHALRAHARRLERIELPEPGIPGNVGSGAVRVVREDRKVRAEVRLADRAEHLAFRGAHRRIGRLTDLSERSVPGRLCVLHQIVRDLIF